MRHLRLCLFAFLFVVSAVPSARAATVAAGEAQSCAISAAGALSCWGGDGNGGYLGTGSTLRDTADPQPVAGMGSGVTHVYSTGSGDGVASTTCAIKSGGAWCWGANGSGQGGNGTTTKELAPRQVSGLGSGVTDISVNTSRACAVHNGAAKCWGASLLGDGTSNGSSVPVIPKFRPQGQHTYPPGGGDTVTPLDSGVTSVAAGWRHVCAIWNGQVVCAGDNTNGQLGYSADDFNYSVTYRYHMRPLSEPLTNPVKLAAGSDMNCALLQNGSVWCWGFNEAGRLGRGSTSTADDDDDPAQVIGLDSGVTDIAANGGHVCAAKGGIAYCWGDGQVGKLGDGPASPHGNDTGTPVQVKNLTGITSLAVSGGHTCAASGGATWCWGGNGHLQLGTDQVETWSGLPVKVVGSTPKPPPAARPAPTPTPTPLPPVARPIARPAPTLAAAIVARPSARLSRTRIATLATIGCPAGATCRASGARTVKLKIRRKTFTATVLGLGVIRAGRTTSLRLRLTKAAARRLGRRSVSVSYRLTTTVNRVARVRTLRVNLTGR